MKAKTKYFLEGFYLFNAWLSWGKGFGLFQHHSYLWARVPLRQMIAGRGVFRVQLGFFQLTYRR